MKQQLASPKIAKGKKKSATSAGSAGKTSKATIPKGFKKIAKEVESQGTHVVQLTEDPRPATYTEVAKEIKAVADREPVTEQQAIPLPMELGEPVADIAVPEIPMVSRFKLEPTDDPHLFRVVDSNGDWIVYYNDKAKKYLWSLTHIIGGGFPMEQGLVNWLKAQTKEDSEKYMEFTGNRGSRVHEGIRDVISGLTVEFGRPYKSRLTGMFEPLTWDEYMALQSWQNWGSIFKPQVRRHECSVATKDFACTLDFDGAITLPKGRKVYINDKLVTMPEDKTVTTILEWKYTGMIRDGHKLQLAAQAEAAKIWPEYTGVVRVGTTHKEGFEIRLWDYNHTRKIHYAQFRRTLGTFLFRNPPYEHDANQYPASISLVVPRIEDKINTPQGEKVNK